MKLILYSWKLVVISSLCLTVGLVGCSGSQNNSVENGEVTSTEVSEQEDGKKKVLTTFTVLADMAQNVAGDKLIVESITRVGAEIHGYEPTPSDLVKAQSADLVLYNGMNLERWFDRFLGNLEDVPSVLLTEGIQPIAIAEGPYEDLPNPHTWMSPKKTL